MTVARLPTVGGDLDAWGTVLNDYLTRRLSAGRVFHLDAYGADPAGDSSCDDAWTACYTAAAAAVATQGPGTAVGSGALILAGPGYYKLTPGVAAITDHRIGLVGAGKAGTVFRAANTGTGSLIKVTGGTLPAHNSMPVSGFTCLGYYAGANVTGLEYGDRPNGTLADVSCREFQASGSRGFWFYDANGNSEGTWAQIEVDQCTVGVDFDCSNPGTGSFDYSQWFIHLVEVANFGYDTVGVRVVNGQHLEGPDMVLVGNISAGTGRTATLMQIGASADDTCYIANPRLHVVVEADAGAGTVKDLMVAGADEYRGLLKMNGTFAVPNFGATLAAGSVTAPAVVTGFGNFNAPLFSSHGTLTSLGSAAAGLVTYVG